MHASTSRWRLGRVSRPLATSAARTSALMAACQIGTWHCEMNMTELHESQQPEQVTNLQECKRSRHSQDRISGCANPCSAVSFAWIDPHFQLWHPFKKFQHRSTDSNCLIMDIAQSSFLAPHGLREIRRHDRNRIPVLRRTGTAGQGTPLPAVPPPCRTGLDAPGPLWPTMGASPTRKASLKL